MSGGRYITLVVVGICAIIFDVLMLDGSIPLALGLAFGIIAAIVLIEFAIAAMFGDE